MKVKDIEKKIGTLSNPSKILRMRGVSLQRNVLQVVYLLNKKELFVINVMHLVVIIYFLLLLTHIR